MKASSLKPLLCSVVMLPFVGCHPTDGGGETVAEGVIWTVDTNWKTERPAVSPGSMTAARFPEATAVGTWMPTGS